MIIKFHESNTKLYEDYWPRYLLPKITTHTRLLTSVDIFVAGVRYCFLIDFRDDYFDDISSSMYLPPPKPVYFKFQTYRHHQQNRRKVGTPLTTRNLSTFLLRRTV
jgi:hypothetical protein